ncbi:MAG: hypothetical protein WHW07_00885 [Bacteroidales bacterium]|jgi:hypothetical protein|nr:hypothetical protein [Bacteroidales bacterium]HOL98785.1 hypothetical protein [Bacteroidales bacterium]HPD24529.1 hypothetical protein [Bacteroidales bacterium]HRT00220.1 hypothetical protein [Bacteroidales bacterium]HUM33183.1 hypothetical protein [Bacteroidales bacterium]
MLPEDIINVYKSGFPNDKVEILNKNSIIAKKDKFIIVIKYKKNKLSVKSDFNLTHPLILSFVIIGIFLGVIPLLLLAIVFYTIYRKKLRKLSTQTFEYLKNNGIK